MHHPKEENNHLKCENDRKKKVKKKVFSNNVKFPHTILFMFFSFHERETLCEISVFKKSHGGNKTTL